MSTFNDIDVTCETCGEEFRATVWTAVHARQDPELRDLLLGGELNMIMCPKCGHIAYQDHFVLYQDPEAELIAYVYPPSQQKDAKELERGMLAGFKEAQSVFEPKQRLAYEPLLIFGLETLVEMMEAEEERGEQSQIAQAICDQQKIPYTILSPATARARKLPRVLPSSAKAKQPTRDQLLAGLERLLQENTALTVYEELRKKILKDSGWAL